jgi:hypothetical protein
MLRQLYVDEVKPSCGVRGKRSAEQVFGAAATVSCDSVCLTHNHHTRVQVGFARGVVSARDSAGCSMRGGRGRLVGRVVRLFVSHAGRDSLSIQRRCTHR